MGLSNEHTKISHGVFKFLMDLITMFLFWIIYVLFTKVHCPWTKILTLQYFCPYSLDESFALKCWNPSSNLMICHTVWSLEARIFTYFDHNNISFCIQLILKFQPDLLIAELYCWSNLWYLVWSSHGWQDPRNSCWAPSIHI